MKKENKYTSIPIAQLLKDAGLFVEVSAVFSGEKQMICDNGGSRFKPLSQDVGLFTYEELVPMFPEYLDVRVLYNGFVVYDLYTESHVRETWSSTKVEAGAKLLLHAEKCTPGYLTEIEELMKTCVEIKNIDVGDCDIVFTEQNIKSMNEITRTAIEMSSKPGDFGQIFHHYLIGNLNGSSTGDYLLSVKDHDYKLGTLLEISPIEDVDRMAKFYVRDDILTNVKDNSISYE